jgi:hypothetical protein
MHENWETSGALRPARERGRSAKAQSHTADPNALAGSDGAIVSMNQTNKEELRWSLEGDQRWSSATATAFVGELELTVQWAWRRNEDERQ